MDLEDTEDTTGVYKYEWDCQHLVARQICEVHVLMLILQEGWFSEYFEGYRLTWLYCLVPLFLSLSAANDTIYYFCDMWKN